MYENFIQKFNFLDINLEIPFFFQGYHGCAIGKGKQVAKTEIEKLKLSELSLQEAVNAAAKMQVFHFNL